MQGRVTVLGDTARFVGRNSLFSRDWVTARGYAEQLSVAKSICVFTGAFIAIAMSESNGNTRKGNETHDPRTIGASIAKPDLSTGSGKKPIPNLGGIAKNWLRNVNSISAKGMESQ
ncbi:MAG: hypothetical protein C5B49_11950 [Bdellovibrio sp.]|nr:MAG: hypothetical protein C5B49_11950 [Bdellovibrio sp.]